MLTDKSGITPNIRMMVEKMNQVGIGEIKRYVKKYHKRENFDRNIAIIRDIAKTGYTGTITKYNFSRKAAEQILKRYYGYALNFQKDGR